MLLWTTQHVHTQSMEIWGIKYIDEGFLIWIISSRYQSYESIYWAHTTSFVTSVYLIIWCLIHGWVYMFWHDFQCMLLIQIYWYMCACLCKTLSIHHTTCWGVSDSPESACPDPRAWKLWILSVADQRCAAKSVDHRQTVWGPILSAPCLALDFSLYDLWPPLYSSLLYISLYSRICAYRWCIILVILCHVLW